MSHLPSHFYEFGPFRLNADERLLLRDCEVVALTGKGTGISRRCPSEAIASWPV